MKYDHTLIKCAELWAEESSCIRLKVGAVLSTPDGRILATGYNGTIKGKSNSCEEFVYSEQGNKECWICKGKGEVSSYSFKSRESKTINCQICGGKGRYSIVTNKFTLHAEQNLLTFCAKNGIATDNNYMYITHSPCHECAKLITQSGIKRVVYLNDYRSSEGIDFLLENDIEVVKL